jgi:hypothetical protein
MSACSTGAMVSVWDGTVLEKHSIVSCQHYRGMAEGAERDARDGGCRASF